jgi:hypothetical protein
LAGAFLGIVLIAWTYLVLWNNIVANQAINEQVVDEVSQYRKATGLDGGSVSRGSSMEPNDGGRPAAAGE